MKAISLGRSGDRLKLSYSRGRLRLGHLDGFGRQWQSNQHGRARTDLRSNIQCAVVEIDRAQGQRQAEAVAVLFGRKIEVENAFQILARDARTAVGDRNLDEP